jgi:circadian clock protein KaiB
MAGTQPGTYRFRLYVTGATARSARAIKNLRTLCDEHLAGRYELEVIDIYQQPHKVVAAQIIAAPTLVKHLPLPLRRFVGDLGDKQRLMAGLDIRSND